MIYREESMVAGVFNALTLLFLCSLLLAEVAGLCVAATHGLASFALAFFCFPYSLALGYGFLLGI